MDSLNEKLNQFLTKSNDIATQDDIPAWFKDFQTDLAGLFGDITSELKQSSDKIVGLQTELDKLKSDMGIQKAVTNALHGERDRLVHQVRQLEIAFDDLEQYSRRNSFMV